MACKVNLRDLITSEANAQGVDPSIALAVAQTESGTCQWAPDGSVITSYAGAIGVFQLEPATAAMLGVDPNDVNQNIQGGIAYLKQMYVKYGNWQSALAAYNWGPGKVDQAIASGLAIPGEVLNYVKGILGMGAVANATTNLMNSQTPAPAAPNATPALTPSDLLTDVTGASPLIIAGAVLAGVGFLAWWMAD